MTQIGTPTDLLKAEPIKNQITIHGIAPVLSQVGMMLTKCAQGLGIDLPPNTLQILSEDVVEVYGSESLEDIREVLKKGRQGHYGFGMEQRKHLSMLVIKSWMEQHLELKYEAKEKELHNQKQELSSTENNQFSQIWMDKIKNKLGMRDGKTERELEEETRKEQFKQYTKQAEMREFYYLVVNTPDHCFFTATEEQEADLIQQGCEVKKGGWNILEAEELCKKLRKGMSWEDL